MTEIFTNFAANGGATATSGTFAFIGASEIIIVLVVALLVFGPQRLPEIGRQIGSLKRQMDRMKDDLHRTIDNLDEYTSLDGPAPSQRYDAYGNATRDDSYNPPYGPTYPQIEGGGGGYNDYEHGDRTTLLDNAYFKEPPGPPARFSDAEATGPNNGNIASGGGSVTYDAPFTERAANGAEPANAVVGNDLSGSEDASRTVGAQSASEAAHPVRKSAA